MAACGCRAQRLRLRSGEFIFAVRGDVGQKTAENLAGLQIHAEMMPQAAVILEHPVFFQDGGGFILIFSVTRPKAKLLQADMFLF